MRTTTQTFYNKYDFCKSVSCSKLTRVDERTWDCAEFACNCVHSAKVFHKWLEQNGFLLVREETNS